MEGIHADISLNTSCVADEFLVCLHCNQPYACHSLIKSDDDDDDYDSGFASKESSPKVTGRIVGSHRNRSVCESCDLVCSLDSLSDSYDFEKAAMSKNSKDLNGNDSVGQEMLTLENAQTLTTTIAKDAGSDAHFLRTRNAAKVLTSSPLVVKSEKRKAEDKLVNSSKASPLRFPSAKSMQSPTKEKSSVTDKGPLQRPADAQGLRTTAVSDHCSDYGGLLGARYSNMYDILDCSQSIYVDSSMYDISDDMYHRQTTLNHGSGIMASKATNHHSTHCDLVKANNTTHSPPLPQPMDKDTRESVGLDCDGKAGLQLGHVAGGDWGMSHIQCVHHQEQAQSMFCVDCSVNTCKLCCSESHRGHTVRNLDIMHMDHVRAVKTGLVSLQGAAQVLQQHCRDLDLYQRDVTQRKSSVLAQLEQRRDHYRHLVDRWYEKSSSHVLSACEDEVQDVASRTKAMHTCAEQITGTTKHAQDYVVTNNNDHIYSPKEYQNLVEQLDTLKQTVDKFEREQENFTGLCFLIGSRHDLDLQSLGTIATAKSRSHYTPNTSEEATTKSTIPRNVLCQRFSHTFDSRGGEGNAYAATGITLTSSNKVIVSDLGMDSVKVFSNSGKYQTCMNIHPGDDPTNAVLLDDYKMVAVSCKNDLKFFRFDNGDFCRRLNRNLECPQGLALDNHGNIVVSEMGSFVPLIHVFDKDTFNLTHTVVGSRSSQKSDTSGHPDFDPCDGYLQTYDEYVFHRPWYLAIDQSGHIFASDREDHVIREVRPEGFLVGSFGGLGAGPGQLFHPAGLCVDKLGLVIVADSQNNRIQVLAPGGQMLAAILNDEEDGIECPMDVAVDNQGHMYVLQADGQVKVFSYYT